MDAAINFDEFSRDPEKRVSVNVTSVVSSSRDWTTNKLSPSTSRTDRNGVQRLAGPLKSRSLIDKSMTNEINQWPSGYCGSLRSIRAAFSSSGKPEDSFCSIVFFETLVISRTIDVYSRYFILEKKKKVLIDDIWSTNINDREEIDVNKMQDGLLFRENIL